VTFGSLQLDSAGIAEDPLAGVFQPRTGTTAYSPTVAYRIVQASPGVAQMFGCRLTGTSLMPEIQPFEPAELSRSSTIYSVSPRKRLDVRPLTLPPFPDQLAEVQVWLGVNKVQLARICRVERQTIYDWFAKNYEPIGANAHRVAQLYRLAVHIRDRAGRPLDTGVPERQLADGSSLLTRLTESTIDLPQALEVTNALLGGADNSPSRTGDALRDRLGWKPIDETQRRDNLKYNLDSLRNR
jgi:hypothetical protein